MNYGAIISGLNTTSTTTVDIEDFDVDVESNVVTLSELRGNAGKNASALDQALSAQGLGIADSKAAIEGNSELRSEIDAALSAEGEFTMDDIVSISTAAEGQLTVVVD